jgi:hypothetical protein
VPTTENFSHYQELVTALSNKHKVNIVVWAQTKEGKSIKWLSKTPQDSDVIVRTPPHLASRLGFLGFCGELVDLFLV